MAVDFPILGVDIIHDYKLLVDPAKWLTPR
jgi:hypothetical protein